MILGPIINAELIRVARQKRWYIMRVLLGLGLLLLCYSAYESGVAWRIRWRQGSPDLTQQELSQLAQQMFATIAIGQGVAILFLTPALLAGAIAEEKQRKTLHYMLASHLTSIEIILGKLVARMMMVMLPVIVGLPVLVMLSMLGGIDPYMLMAIYGASFTTILFEASLAILMSTLVRRGREALLLTFLVGLAWFIGPPILESLMVNGDEPWPAFYERWIAPINRHLSALTPVGLTVRSSPALRGGPPAMVAAIWNMVGHQAVGTLMLVGLATWSLRPVFRRQDGGTSRKIGKGRIARFLTRTWWKRPIGDRAMLWKETYGTPGSLLAVIVSLITVATIVLLAYEPLRECMPNVWSELRTHGYHVGDDTGRRDLSITLRICATGIFCVWALLITVNAATSVSKEREEDTWISLISTPLGAREIYNAKIVGSFWSTRHLAYAIIVIWLIGLALGSLHPLGLLISAVQLGSFGLFLVAAGTFFSLWSKTTMRSIGLAVGLLIFLSLLLPMILATVIHDGPYAAIPSIPYLFAAGMLRYHDVDEYILGTIRYTSAVAEWQERMRIQTTWSVTIGSILYVCLAPILLILAWLRLDRVLDRPRRGNLAQPVPTLTKPKVRIRLEKDDLPATPVG
jgi:ABC-type transport system involved in multi-copper enzyme maturation permease subunit